MLCAVGIGANRFERQRAEQRLQQHVAIIGVDRVAIGIALDQRCARRSRSGLRPNLRHFGQCEQAAARILAALRVVRGGRDERMLLAGRSAPAAPRRSAARSIPKRRGRRRLRSARGTAPRDRRACLPGSSPSPGRSIAGSAGETARQGLDLARLGAAAPRTVEQHRGDHVVDGRVAEAALCLRLGRTLPR